MFECSQVQTDRGQPFCWPSWLSFDGQKDKTHIQTWARV